VRAGPVDDDLLPESGQGVAEGGGEEGVAPAVAGQIARGGRLDRPPQPGSGLIDFHGRPPESEHELGRPHRALRLAGPDDVVQTDPAGVEHRAVVELLHELASPACREAIAVRRLVGVATGGPALEVHDARRGPHVERDSGVLLEPQAEVDVLHAVDVVGVEPADSGEVLEAHSEAGRGQGGELVVVQRRVDVGRVHVDVEVPRHGHPAEEDGAGRLHRPVAEQEQRLRCRDGLVLQRGT
jgi:hypothetical protein